MASSTDSQYDRYWFHLNHTIYARNREQKSNTTCTVFDRVAWCRKRYETFVAEFRCARLQILQQITQQKATAKVSCDISLKASNTLWQVVTAIAVPIVYFLSIVLISFFSLIYFLARLSRHSGLPFERTIWINSFIHAFILAVFVINISKRKCCIFSTVHCQSLLTKITLTTRLRHKFCATFIPRTIPPTNACDCHRGTHGSIFLRQYMTKHYTSKCVRK